MKHINKKQALGLCKSYLSFLALFAFIAGNGFAQVRKIESFDANWHFYKGDIQGAEKLSFNDSAWRLLNVPHDWSIEGPYDKANPTARGGGYLPAGIGWYRKDFTLGEADAQKQHFIEFDGVMANSDVWINGVHLGKRPYGYISFAYDLTKHLNYGKGKTNTIAVRADNTIQPASRYYTGAGIYRHVRLVSVNPVHFTQWGTYITSPVVTKEKATVNIKSEVENKSQKSGEYTFQTTIVDAAGKVVKTAESKLSIPAGEKVEFNQNLQVYNTKLCGI